MSKQLTPLQALEEICEKGCDFCDLYNYEHNKKCKEEMGGCANCIFCGKEYNLIEKSLIENGKLKECYENELKNSAYYNNLALKYKKALEIIKKLLDLKISQGRKHYLHISVGSFRVAYDVSKLEWNTLKEVLK